MMILDPYRFAAPASSLLSVSGLTKIGNLTLGGGLTAVFDTTTSQTHNAAGGGELATAPNHYAGVDWGSGVTKTITEFKIYGPNDENMTGGAANTMTADLYGSNSSPTNSTDGTLLCSAAALTNSGANMVNDITTGITTTTAYRYNWVRITTSPSAQTAIAEVQFYGY